MAPLTKERPQTNGVTSSDSDGQKRGNQFPRKGAGEHFFGWRDRTAAANSKAIQSASYSEIPPLGKLFLTEAHLVKEFPPGVLTVRKLRYWRAMRIGMPWTKIGRTVVYERQSVLEFLKRNQLNLEREQPPIRRVHQPRRGR